VGRHSSRSIDQSLLRRRKDRLSCGRMGKTGRSCGWN